MKQLLQLVNGLAGAYPFSVCDFELIEVVVVSPHYLVHIYLV